MKQRSRQKGRSNMPAWTNEVRDAWQHKMEASKEYCRAKKLQEDQTSIEAKRKAFNEETSNFKEQADTAKREVWESFCQECDPSDPSTTSKFWVLFKQMKCEAGVSSCAPQQIFDDNGNPLRTDEEKGSAFRDRYIAQLQQDSEPKVRAAWEHFNGLIVDGEDGDNQPAVDVQEIQVTLRKIRKDTAPGPDGVKYSHLKALPAEDLEKLATMVNKAMMDGEVPDDWLHCNMAILPKPNKDHTKLKGFRIITMCNVWTKICEKVAAQRLVKDLEERGCLPPQVGGARPGRSSTSNIEATAHRTQQAMQQQQHMAIGFFDLEDAYNRVDVGILARKMAEMNISKVLIRWVLCLLGSRTCSMRFGTWRSEPFKVSSGLPQGSPLSSVLFNIYTADLIPCLSTITATPSTYVDDIIVECVGNTQRNAVDQLQLASDGLADWTADNNMRIQGDKSLWMLASLGHQREPFHITYEGVEVPQVKQATGLGCVLDSRMNMNAHLLHLRDKALKGISTLKLAAAQDVTQASLVKLMKATVSSRADYGLHIASCASEKAVQQLQRVENQAMRIVTGSTRKNPNDALHHWLGIPRIRDRQAILGTKAFLKATCTASHPLHEEIVNGYDQSIPQRLTTIKSWVRAARETIEEVTAIENLKQDDWIEWHNHPFETAILGSREWRDRDGSVNDAWVRGYIFEKQPSYVIATDGSIHDNITAWGGVVWKEGTTVFEWSTGRHGKSSSYRAEGEALEDALFWIAQKTNVNDFVMILTDSLSLVSRIRHGRIMRRWVPTMQQIAAEVEITYIPGHAGIKLNEKADKLAGGAEPFGDLTMTPADVVRTVAENKQATHDMEPPSWSLMRLREGHVKSGEGATSRLRGPQRKLRTQTLMGHVTQSTLDNLLEMFEGRGPRTLPEPLLSW